MRLLKMLEKGTGKFPLVQLGVVVLGDGLTCRQHVERARADGYSVVICSGYIEFYRP